MKNKNKNKNKGSTCPFSSLKKTEVNIKKQPMVGGPDSILKTGMNVERPMVGGPDSILKELVSAKTCGATSFEKKENK